MDRDVAQCAAVLRNKLEKGRNVSLITEARINVSTGQGEGPGSSPLM